MFVYIRAEDIHVEWSMYSGGIGMNLIYISPPMFNLSTGYILSTWDKAVYVDNVIAKWLLLRYYKVIPCGCVPCWRNVYWSIVKHILYYIRSCVDFNSNWIIFWMVRYCGKFISKISPMEWMYNDPLLRNSFISGEIFANFDLRVFWQVYDGGINLSAGSYSIEPVTYRGTEEFDSARRAGMFNLYVHKTEWNRFS